MTGSSDSDSIDDPAQGGELQAAALGADPKLDAHAFSGHPDGLAVLDADWRILQANLTLSRMLAAGERPLTGLGARDFIDALQLDLDELARIGSTRAETTLGTLDGSIIPVELGLCRLAPLPAEAELYLLSARDLSDRARDAQRLERTALYDALTGLPNRISLERRLRATMPDALSGEELALLFIDLDNFQAINDSLGHAAGDELLCEVAMRLKGWVGQGDYLARCGGDEFCVISRAGSARERAERLARRLLEILAEPIDIGEQRLRISASIGIALAPEHADSADQLFKLADRAKSAAKRRGRAGYLLQGTQADAGAAREGAVLEALRAALEQRQLGMAAQGKVDREGRLIGYETLIRWTHAALGPVSPAEFVPLAERHGLAHRLGEIAVQQALAFAGKLRARGLDLEVSINLSPHQFGDPETLDLLRRACRRSRVPPERICLEITESAVIEDAQAAHDRLAALRGEGFAVALDDFGVGYASLAHLRLLPLDKVKIDRSFISDAVEHAAARSLLQGVVGLCHSLGFRVAAEGVETDAQLALLRELQVNEMQGYLFSRPLMLEQVLAELPA